MKKTLRRAAALALAALMMLTLLTACGGSSGDKAGINKTISAYQSACRDMDVRGMLECMNPSISKPVLSMMDMMGMDAAEALLDKAFGMLGLLGEVGEMAEESIEQYTIQPKDYDFNGDKDECAVTATVSAGKGTEEETVIYMVKVDGKWYISGMN